MKPKVMLSQSIDPITAVTARDPYRFYGALTARQPLYFDERLQLWVASSAGVVRAILNNSAFRVRPADEAVPRALQGRRSGEVFRHLVRMQDGGRQAALKGAVCESMTPLDPDCLIIRSESWMQHLVTCLFHAEGREPVPDPAFCLPVYVVGAQLGIPSDLLPRTVGLMDDFVCSLAPGCAPEELDRGDAASEALWSLFSGLLRQAEFPNPTEFRGRPADLGLLSSFARSACRHAGHDKEVIVANAIGFLSQSYEATAGLIGNSLIALSKRPELRKEAQADPVLLRAVIREVARIDSPVQNTRRFLAEDVVLEGYEMRTGEAVLLILAAANRDPAVNPDPSRFDPLRESPTLFTFSAGAHLCPGMEMACAMTQGALQQILRSPTDLDRLCKGFEYRSSKNGRIPLLNWRSAMAGA